MPDVNNTPTIDASAFKDILDPMSQHRFDSLRKTLHHGESGRFRSIGAGRHPGYQGRGGGNDGVEVSREIAQGWLDSGELKLDTDMARRATLRKEPVDAVLEKLGLKRPAND